MLDIHRTDSVPDTKIYFSHSLLPSYIDPQNVSTKKKPFSTFHAQHFTHTLHLTLPSETWDLVRTALQTNPLLSNPHYARVHMSLAELLDAEFLAYYIKQGGPIMMLSEGRPLIDPYLFSLYDGKLTLELDRPTYERCGLQGGTPVEDGGRKHQKQRWRVEYDLRSPSMKHGKKGFGRLEWAAQNVLNRSLSWLFCHVGGADGSAEALREGREVLNLHAPRVEKAEMRVERLTGVVVPKIATRNVKDEVYGEEEALGMLEYLHMLNLGSPRVYQRDAIDAHLSRYEVPDLGARGEERDLVQVCWRGFIAPRFARELFLLVRECGFKGRGEMRGKVRGYGCGWGWRRREVVQYECAGVWWEEGLECHAV
ncbi:hypothetical protein N0V83_006849 [Neocucurbitaria cava]|uniref:Uncharacterized protein n=1 Tax=Neocucurbitaria cava TaxID=798079 RepID=A0A9W8Y492_9PLEO|nr:hypothetical protein N0V83_006849 [Neocucurbitaria cava]